MKRVPVMVSSLDDQSNRRLLWIRRTGRRKVRQVCHADLFPAPVLQVTTTAYPTPPRLTNEGVGERKSPSQMQPPSRHWPVQPELLRELAGQLPTRPSSQQYASVKANSPFASFCRTTCIELSVKNHSETGNFLPQGPQSPKMSNQPPKYQRQSLNFHSGIHPVEAYEICFIGIIRRLSAQCGTTFPD
jgi:hypothetical protein